MHPDFESRMLDFDFSLIQLAKSIVFNLPTKIPITLADENEIIPDNSAVMVSGWGDTLSNAESSVFLRAVTLNIFNFEECDKIYRNYGGITDRMICAKSNKKDSCQG